MAIVKSLEKNEVNKTAQNVYEGFEQKTGNVPEWVKTMAHSPKILKEFTELFRTIMEEGEIDTYLKWKIAYVVSETLKCEFCVSVTMNMLKKLGATDTLLKDISTMNNLTKKENNTLALVKDITIDGHLDNPKILDKLKKEFSEPQIVEIVSVIGLFNYINRFNNALIILPI
jgi:uncharacterized peroxidase-related enzyme